MSHEKVIVISIRPEHTPNITSGRKKYELRKTLPKGFIGWVYIYETFGKTLYVNETTWGDKYPEWYGYEIYNKRGLRCITQGRGQIVARFWYDEHNKIFYVKDRFYDRSYEWSYEQQRQLCLTDEQIHLYGKNKDLYAWHIKKLEVFDEPMQLDEFYKDYDTMDTDSNGNYIGWYEIGINPLQRPPQSWQYAWRKENSNAI